MKVMVAGSHRRQRSPAPRPGRGVAWTGFFLLLAAVAVIATRHLWSELVSGVLGLSGPGSPQATVLWRATCPPGSSCSINASGGVLLAFPDSSGSAAAPMTAISQASAGQVTPVGTARGALLAAAFPPPGAHVAEGDRTPGTGDWRMVVVRPHLPVGAEGPDFLLEETVWLDAGAGTAGTHVTTGAVVTAAVAWVDDAVIALGVYAPGAGREASGSVVAVGPGGDRRWIHTVGSGPPHRLSARPGKGFVAAADPSSVALLDSSGNLLWTKDLRAQITDLGLQSHGGPAVVAGGRLLAYDRRGNLLWRKAADTPLVSVDCASNRIAVGAGDRVVVYDEDGLERWSLACASSPADVALDPEGRLLAVVLASGSLVVAEAPESSSERPASPSPATTGPGRTGRSSGGDGT